METKFKLILLSAILCLVNGCVSYPPVSQFQIGFTEKDIAEVCQPYIVRKELVAEKIVAKANIKVIRHWLNSDGRPIPYLFTLIKPSLTEAEIQNIINKSGIDLNEPNNLEFAKSRLEGQNYWLLNIMLDEGERTRQFAIRQAAASNFLQCMQTMNSMRPKTYYMYPTGTRSYMIREGR